MKQMMRRMAVFAMVLMMIFSLDTNVLAAESAAADNEVNLPEKALSVPANISISDEHVMTFELVEGADHYEVYMMVDWASNPESEVHWASVRLWNEDSKDGKTLSWDYSDFYEEFDFYAKEDEYKSEGELSIKVRAVSEDADGVQSSAWSDDILLYEYRFTTEEMEENLQDAFESEDPAYIQYTLINISNDTIVEMLENDAEFASKVTSANDAQKTELGKWYKAPVSTTEVVDASKVNVVGDALNAYLTEKVQLTFAAPATPVTVPETYKNAVQMDINLWIDDTAQGELRVPIMITMPIPEGVSEENLVMLHYHEEGKEPVVITPIINDGNMTFTVAGLSVFVVANEVTAEPAPMPEPEPTPEPTPTPEPEQTPAPGTESPKSGDITPVGVLCVLMMFSAAVVVVVIKKDGNVKRKV